MFFCQYMTFFLTLFLSMSSQAIIIRHDTLDKYYQELAKPYTRSLAYLDRCVATVLSEYWLITAQHCVSKKNYYPLQISHSGVKYPVEEIVLNPNSVQFDDLDIALLRLKWPLEDAKPVAIYGHDDELNKRVVFVGKGLTGNGITGEKVRDKIERAATNTVSKVEKNWLNFTFDSPSSEDVTELEGISGVEDSGGPAFINTEHEFMIAGVGCCQVPVVRDNEEELQGGYFSTEYYSRLSPHKVWIEQKINAEIPKAIINSNILKALAVNKIDLAKSLFTENKLWLNDQALISEVLIYSFYRSNDLSYFLLHSFPELYSHKINGLPLTTYAYMQGNSVILSLLIELGVAMDYSGFRGQQLPSLITWQYFNDDYQKQIKLLITQGLNINTQDTKGDSALHMAIYLGWPERVRILLALGADINQINKKGNSALIDAARKGNLAIVKILIAEGADIRHKNNDRKGAEVVAKEAGHHKLAQYLRSVSS